MGDEGEGVADSVTMCCWSCVLSCVGGDVVTSEATVPVRLDVSVCVRWYTRLVCIKTAYL